MYSPAVEGFSIRGSAVRCSEAPPTDDLAEVIHCFRVLRTWEALPHDALDHALSNACVNLLFHPVDPRIAGVQFHPGATPHQGPPFARWLTWLLEWDSPRAGLISLCMDTEGILFALNALQEVQPLAQPDRLRRVPSPITIHRSHFTDQRAAPAAGVPAGWGCPSRHRAGFCGNGGRSRRPGRGGLRRRVGAGRRSWH